MVRLADQAGEAKAIKTFAEAEVSLKRAGWRRRDERVAQNPVTVASQVARFEADMDAYSRIAEKMAKPNLVMEFLNTQAGAAVVSAVLPAIMGKLLGPGAASDAAAASGATKENPVAANGGGDLGTILQAMAQQLQAVDARLAAVEKKRGGK